MLGEKDGEKDIRGQGNSKCKGTVVRTSLWLEAGLVDEIKFKASSLDARIYDKLALNSKNQRFRIYPTIYKTAMGVPELPDLLQTNAWPWTMTKYNPYLQSLLTETLPISGGFKANV